MNEIMNCERFLIPRKINYQASLDLTKGIDLVVVAAIREAQALDWTFYVCDSNRGRCQYASKTITIPTFAMMKGKTYKNWYIAHEIAHTYAGFRESHGPVFMNWLKKICPEDSIHHELGYKPRNAASAGILSCTDF